MHDVYVSGVGKLVEMVLGGQKGTRTEDYLA